MTNSKAIIIVGINRGGTSAVASSLNPLGIHLGDTSAAPIFEDKKLSNAFRSKDWKKLKQIADEYVLEHGLYAWKLPDTRHQLKKIEKLLGGVRFVFVFRDICAISFRKQKALDIDALRSMSDSVRSYDKIIKFASKRPNDHLLLSYEKILTAPESYATSLLEFIGFEVSSENIKKITDVISISPKEYNVWADKLKQKNDLDSVHGISGQLHRVDANVVVGWAKWINSDKKMELTLLVNNKEVARFGADQFQQHLINTGFSKSGNRGYRIKMPPGLENGTEVAVVESSSGAHLVGSPTKLEL